MSVERVLGGTSLIEVLDRVLDKGIAIDRWARVSLVGIDLITIETRVVVASDDHDDGGPGGSGSSGAPAVLEYPLTPRRREPSPRDRTRRRHRQ
jgi:hypothetical protein